MSPAAMFPAPGRRRDASVAIERAAIELFSRGRFETVTAAAIADAAGVSVRTFYRNFAAKEEILGRLPMRQARQVASATLRRPAREAPFAAVRAAIAELAGADDPELRRWQRAVGRARESERMSQVVVATTAPVLGAALAERAGIARDHIWAEVGGAMMATAMVTGARRWAEHGGSLADEILDAVDVVGAGLRRQPSG